MADVALTPTTPDDPIALDPSLWRERLAPYARASVPRSVVDIFTSAVPYVVLTVAMYYVLQVSVVLMLLLAVPTAGFLLRTFIVFHDCSHGSFLPWRKANAWVGVTCGLLVYSPFHSWRYEHAVHHATAGDLDRRGTGDVETLTVAEYAALPRGKRLAYRLFRNPLIMLGIGPVWALMIQPRLVPRWARERFGLKIIATDIVVVGVVTAMCLLLGWTTVLLLQLPTAMIAGAIGVWLFYVQHQFEGVYWVRKDEWSYAESALRGSSHLKLPKVLQFFTGNIGLHHVHHLSARIPNYNLQRAHDENPVFHDVPEIGLFEGIRNMRLKLYDEERGRMVTFSEAVGARSRRPAGPRVATAAPERSA